MSTLDAPLRAPEDWFAANGWQAFDFQREVWAAMRQGRSGLLHASTGAGKT
jgi:ATP-dependent Lhr-like helicase